MYKPLTLFLLITSLVSIVLQPVLAADVISKQDITLLDECLKKQDWQRATEMVKNWHGYEDEIHVFNSLCVSSFLSDEALFWSKLRLSQLYYESQRSQDALELLRPLKEIEEEGEPEQIAQLNILLSDIYEEQSLYDSSMIYVDALLQAKADQYLKQSLSDLYNRKANLYNRLHDYTNALIHYAKVIEHADGDSTAIANAYHGYAYAHRNLGQLDSSAFYEYKSLRISDAINYDHGRQLAYQALSILFFYQKDYQKSIDFGKQLVGLAEPEDKKSLIANTYNVIGLAYAFSSRPDSGLYYHRKSLALKKELGNKNLICSSLNNIAAAFLIKQMPDSAITYLLQAKPIFESMQDTLKLSSLYVNIGKVYLENKDFANARQFYEKAYDYAERKGAVKESITGLEGLMQVDTLQGNYQSAFEYQSRILKLQEKFIGIEKQKEILKLQEEFQSEKKEEEIKTKQALLEAEQSVSKVKGRFLVGLMCLLVVCVFLLLVYFRLNKRNKKLKNKNAILLREQNHRIKNNLQSIVSMLSLQSNRIEDVGVKKVLEESQLRIQTIEMIHRCLYGAESSVVNVTELFPDLVESILFALNRQDVSVNYSFGKTNSFKVEKALSLALILNELVTNSCEHGLTAGVRIPQISISLQHSSNSAYRFKYTDNGIGFDYEAITLESKSFGLRLINLKSKELSGECSIKSGENGFVYSLDFSPN